MGGSKMMGESEKTVYLFTAFITSFAHHETTILAAIASTFFGWG